MLRIKVSMEVIYSHLLENLWLLLPMHDVQSPCLACEVLPSLPQTPGLFFFLPNELCPLVRQAGVLTQPQLRLLFLPFSQRGTVTENGSSPG